MILAYALAFYLLLGLTLMGVGLQAASQDPKPYSQKEVNAIIWWSWFWPYMLIRALVLKVI